MSYSGKKETFLKAGDSLGTLINDKASELFFALKNFDTASLGSSDEYKDYFVNHHLGKRLFFSIQNSAHILYESVKMCGKPLNEINAIDYGAGLGTLFMLGGMLGFKRFDYNDHLPEWEKTATAVFNEINGHINDYVIGDINAVTAFAAANNFRYDIIVSRNVIEHIYSLPEFYSAIFKHNPKAVTYSTTTANYHNPVMRWYHVYIHNKAEKGYYRQQRTDEIKNLHPALQPDKILQLAALTRGRGQKDFTSAITDFINNIEIKKERNLRSNTCDCITGVWCEHLLTKQEHGAIIENTGFKMLFTGGYWDTHYSSVLKNLMARLFNKIILLLGKKKAVVLSPFINVVAYN